ncbi:hypothetical protein AYX14_07115, partial [Cryptococcus neoformans]
MGAAGVVLGKRDDKNATSREGYSFRRIYTANVIAAFTSTSHTHPPPPTPNERSPSTADPAQGKGLKKTHVNDRSAPQVAGSVAGAAGAAGGAAATGRPPAAPRPPASAPPVPSGNDPASQLAGLFAGGMPALRKTGDRAA